MPSGVYQRTAYHGQAISAGITDEVKKRVAELNSGWTYSDEDRLKISNRLKDRTFTPEHRQALSYALSGRILTLEHKQHISIALTGKTGQYKPRTSKRKSVLLTESHKQSLSDAIKLYWSKLSYDERKTRLVNFHCSKFYDTNIELIIQSILSDLGIYFVKQQYLAGFCVDFYVQDNNIAIEADGVYWHSQPGAKEWDKHRDNIIETKTGVWVVRIPEKDIWNGTARETLTTLLVEPSEMEQ